MLHLTGQFFPFFKWKPYGKYMHCFGQCRQVDEVDLIWRFAFKRLMRPFVVAELEIYFQVLFCIIYAVVSERYTPSYLTLHQRRSTVIAAYPLFALSNPALVNALSKISLSPVPITRSWSASLDIQFWPASPSLYHSTL